MKTHELKTWPAFFQAVADGVKTFEIRKNDRGIKVGDVLKLREFEEGVGYSGRQIFRKVTYITDFGQPDGQVVFGLMDISKVKGMLYQIREAARSDDCEEVLTISWRALQFLEGLDDD